MTYARVITKVVVLAGLQVCQVPCFVVHVTNLFVELLVEPPQSLAPWRVDCLIKVRFDAVARFCELVGHMVLVVCPSRVWRSVVPGVKCVVLCLKLLYCFVEFGAKAVLLVQLDSLLNDAVGEVIAVGEILGEDAGVRFVGLREVVMTATVSIVGALFFREEVRV